MDRISIKMDAAKAGRLIQLAEKVDMHLEAYCAMVLANHLMRKAEIDDKGAQS